MLFQTINSCSSSKHKIDNYTKFKTWEISILSLKIHAAKNFEISKVHKAL